MKNPLGTNVGGFLLVADRASHLDRFFSDPFDRGDEIAVETHRNRFQIFQIQGLSHTRVILIPPQHSHHFINETRAGATVDVTRRSLCFGLKLNVSDQFGVSVSAFFNESMFHRIELAIGAGYKTAFPVRESRRDGFCFGKLSGEHPFRYSALNKLFLLRSPSSTKTSSSQFCLSSSP